MEIDVNRDGGGVKPPMAPAAPVAAQTASRAENLGEMLKQQFKLGVALKKAQDARLLQLKRQLEQVKREAAAPTGIVAQRRVELAHEQASLESSLAVRQQFVDKCTQLQEQGRNPELPALIFYQVGLRSTHLVFTTLLTTRCARKHRASMPTAETRTPTTHTSGASTATSASVAPSSSRTWSCSRLPQTSSPSRVSFYTTRFSRAKSHASRLGIRSFADYTAMFPHLLRNHCADDEQAKADHAAKEKLRMDAELNAALKKEQEEWWLRTGAKNQMRTWWHGTAHQLIEREKAAGNYAGKLPSAQARLAKQILKSVGMALSQSWLREKNTSQLGAYPPFWSTLVESGVYSDAPVTDEVITLSDVLPNWDYKEQPPEELPEVAEGEGEDQDAMAAMVAALRAENAKLSDKLAKLGEQRMDTAMMARDPRGSISSGSAVTVASRRVKEMEKKIQKLSKKMANTENVDEQEELREERDACADILRDTLDLVRNKFSRQILVS
jgi:hypothetical protein